MSPSRRHWVWNDLFWINRLEKTTKLSSSLETVNTEIRSGDDMAFRLLAFISLSSSHQTFSSFFVSPLWGLEASVTVEHVKLLSLTWTDHSERFWLGILLCYRVADLEMEKKAGEARLWSQASQSSCLASATFSLCLWTRDLIFLIMFPHLSNKDTYSSYLTRLCYVTICFTNA